MPKTAENSGSRQSHPPCLVSAGRRRGEANSKDWLPSPSLTAGRTTLVRACPTGPRSQTRSALVQSRSQPALDHSLASTNKPKTALTYGLAPTQEEIKIKVSLWFLIFGHGSAPGTLQRGRRGNVRVGIETRKDTTDGRRKPQVV